METTYMIAKSHNTETLTEQVNARIKEGWIPQGGITVTNASSIIFAQALILKA